MPVRRVLMTADTVGGVWTYAVELARALAGFGVETTLAVMGGEPAPDQREEARGLQLFAAPYRLEWMEDPWEDVAGAGRWLLELERRVRPDVVHLNGYAHAALAWRAPVLVAAHSCVLSWWEAVKHEPAPARWDRYRREVARGLAAAAAVVAPTRAMLDCLPRHYGPLRGARVIPNGRDPARFFHTGEKEQLVFAAGRMWDEAKNLAALDAAACRLPWPVFVAGEAGRPAAGVHLLGRFPAACVAEWLSRAAIYALPARYEPFGLSALEAALSGCALVLGDIPSLREVWGDAACFAPPEDPDVVRRAIAELIENPDLRSRMAAKARLRALEYSPRRMAEEYMSVYGDTVHRVGPPPRRRVTSWRSGCS